MPVSDPPFGRMLARRALQSGSMNTRTEYPDLLTLGIIRMVDLSGQVNVEVPRDYSFFKTTSTSNV